MDYWSYAFFFVFQLLVIQPLNVAKGPCTYKLIIGKLCFPMREKKTNQGSSCPRQTTQKRAELFPLDYKFFFASKIFYFLSPTQFFASLFIFWVRPYCTVSNFLFPFVTDSSANPSNMMEDICRLRATKLGQARSWLIVIAFLKKMCFHFRK